MKYYDVLQTGALEAAYKLKGLSVMITSLDFEPSDIEERDAFIGIGMIIKDLSIQAEQIYSLLDQCHRPKTNDFEVTIPRTSYNQLSALYTISEAERNYRRYNMILKEAGLSELDSRSVQSLEEALERATREAGKRSLSIKEEEAIVCSFAQAMTSASGIKDRRQYDNGR